MRARTGFLVFASLLFVVGLWAYLPGRIFIGARAYAALQHQIAQAEDIRAELRSQLAAITKSEFQKVAEIQQLERDQSALSENLVVLKGLLERANQDQVALRSQVNSYKAQAAEAESRIKEGAELVAELKNELEKERIKRIDTEASLIAQQERVRGISDKLVAQMAVNERERQLLAAGREIRDLMGARNLHIIDVFDVDGKGRSKGAFGRAFYTEGKSLIFYAFDLAPNTPLRSFQAWGLQPGTQPAQSLGIFYADDKTQNRWVLKFDEPGVLAQIDAVFVTIEPPGGSPQPTGQKLLYAYLNGKANHP
jgi:cell division protein FtsB